MRRARAATSRKECTTPDGMSTRAGRSAKHVSARRMGLANVFTGDHLVISALGPAIDYEIKVLTKTEMVLVSRIEGVDIATETRFDRKK